MNALATLSNSLIGNENVTVDASTGVAWVSQVKLAKMCGVAQQTINSAITRKSKYAVNWNLNENNQLDAKSAYNAVVYFATKGNIDAVKTLATIGEAGIQAYLYHEAGYEITVTSLSTELVKDALVLSPKELKDEAAKALIIEKHNTALIKLEAARVTAELKKEKALQARELARLNHANKLQQIKDRHTRIMSQGSKLKADGSADYKDSVGRTYPVFNLPKRECLILVQPTFY